MNKIDRQVYRNEFVPYMLKQGRIVSFLAYIGMFIPSLILMVFFNIKLNTEMFSIAFLTVFALVAPTMIGPIYMYPILGLPGTLLTFIAGDANNIRVPCSIAAQEAAEVEVGTEEASVISSIGIGVSVIVKIVIVFTFMTFLFSVLVNLDSSILVKINMMVPALIGAVTAKFCLMKIRCVPVVIVTGLCIEKLMNIGIIPSYLGTLVVLIISVAVTYFLFKKEIID